MPDKELSDEEDEEESSSFFFSSSFFSGLRWANAKEENNLRMEYISSGVRELRL